jgi:hypothetical protein
MSTPITISIFQSFENIDYTSANVEDAQILEDFEYVKVDGRDAFMWWDPKEECVNAHIKVPTKRMTAGLDYIDVDRSAMRVMEVVAQLKHQLETDNSFTFDCILVDDRIRKGWNDMSREDRLKYIYENNVSVNTRLVANYKGLTFDFELSLDF